MLALLPFQLIFELPAAFAPCATRAFLSPPAVLSLPASCVLLPALLSPLLCLALLLPACLVLAAKQSDMKPQPEFGLDTIITLYNWPIHHHYVEQLG